VNFHSVEECLDHPTCDVLAKQWNDLVWKLNVIVGAEITLICLVFHAKLKRRYFRGAKFASFTGNCCVACLRAAYNYLWGEKRKSADPNKNTLPIKEATRWIWLSIVKRGTTLTSSFGVYIIHYDIPEIAVITLAAW
jgi:hypothetical protein